MRLRRSVSGTLLILVAVVLLAAAFTVQFPEGTHSADTPWSVSSASGQTVAATLKWEGATPSTHVYVARGAADCSDLTKILSTGSGASGSLSLQLAPATTYSIFVCGDSAAGSTQLTLSAVGAQGYALPLEILAAMLAFAGALVLLWGSTRRRGARRRQIASRGWPRH